MLVAGVDEAGRGPVLGPMVLCAYAVEEGQQERLREMGARDSKVLTPQQRESLAKKLRKGGEFALNIITAQELTAMMRRRTSLNDIEARSISQALRELGGKGALSRAYVDSPDPVAKKFELRIRKYFDHGFEIVCEHKADSTYPVVSAASILAKVERDAQIGQIKEFLKQNGFEDWDFGSGYSHDERTVGFLKRHHNDALLQPFIRHEWETTKRLKSTQLELGKYL